MKNIAMSNSRQAETVAFQDLLDVMKARRRYTVDDVLALLPDRPRTAVRDTLHALVAKGFVWRDATKAHRVRYSLLEGADLRSAIERSTVHAERPAWMNATLTGYDRAHHQFRELCELTRRK